MTRDPLPEPWRVPLERKGITTKRGLATAVGVSPETARRLVDGIRRPSSETVNAVADTLFAGDRNYVWSLVGTGREDHGEFELPPEASQLNEEQREAVLAVVRAMLPREGRRGGAMLPPSGDPPQDNVHDLVPPIEKAAAQAKKAARKGKPQARDNGGEDG